MRFGVSCAVISAAEPVEALRDYIALAEESGMLLLGAGDIMTRNFECYVEMTLLAMCSRRARFMSTMTNPVTRHPGVVASAWASLQKISGGRAVMGIAVGNSAVANIGLPRATLADLREHILTVRALVRDGEADYRGAKLHLPLGPQLAPGGIPIYMAADGPKALELAGEVADGVMIGGGISRAYVAEALAALGRGAQKAGRKLSDIDRWFKCEIALAENRPAAIRSRLDILSAIGGQSLRTGFAGKAVPPEMQPAILEFNRRYDFTQHVTGPNGALVEELGLTDFFADRLLIGGAPDEVVDQLRTVASYGVDQIHASNIGGDPHGFLRDFRDQVLPRVTNA
ncbi:MAG: LLM class flavin-dependent oxidoreductase [Caulobacteraceae bacterium]|nr:LLM class flavin-dependent oxidoreductase [Caulobacteraceae bacterium]